MPDLEAPQTPFDAVLDAFQLASLGHDREVEAFVERGTGRTILRSDLADMENLPEDADPDDWVRLPTTRELGLAKPLALEFADTRLPADFDYVREIFGRRGAFRAFDDLLRRRGALDDWRTFQAAAEESALRAWCDEIGLDLAG